MTLLLASAALNARTPTVSDLADIQADRMLLSAELERAKLREALAMQASSAQTNAAGMTSPSLRMVYGSQGVNIGLFVYSDGGTATAKAGDTLPGRYIVRSVGLQGAELVAHDARVIRVPLSRNAPAEPVPASDSGRSPSYRMPREPAR
ncbi:type IV pilus biogenesis protein PilP [Pinirhizobacter soli]|uniref:type IV pilus biogenesis protein PilP n=1 Tax=Pinirhizobacter soli TaxID=2786953 RepID=UPI00202AA060